MAHKPFPDLMYPLAPHPGTGRKDLFVGVASLLAALAIFFHGFYGSWDKEAATVLTADNVGIDNVKFLRNDLVDSMHVTGIIHNKSRHLLTSVQLEIGFYDKREKIYSATRNIYLFVPSGKSRDFDEYLPGGANVQAALTKYDLEYEVVSASGEHGRLASGVAKSQDRVRLWQWQADMSGDGQVTLADAAAWLGWLYYYPGDFLLASLHDTPAEYVLRDTPADFGSLLSFLISLVCWLLVWLYVSGVVAFVRGRWRPALT